MREIDCRAIGDVKLVSKRTLGLVSDGAIAVIGILAAAIPTFLGFASNYFPWAAKWLSNLPIDTISLSLLGILLTYVIVERRTIFQDSLDKAVETNNAAADKLSELQQRILDLGGRLDQNTSRIIESTSGIETIAFDNAIDLKKYVNDMTKAAKSSVLDSTWAHPTNRGTPRTPQENAEFQKIEKQHSDIVARVSKSRTYRELFILSRPARIEKLERRQKDRSPGYFCRVIPESHVPRLQFIVIDSELAIFVSSNHASLFAIRHAALVKVLIDYFDDAWNSESAISLVEHQGAGAVWDDELTNQTIQAAKTALAVR